MVDLRSRPWRVVRVIVEVTVPPTSKTKEKDLQYAVQSALPSLLSLPRPIHDNAHQSRVRVKCFTPFLPMYLRAQRGLNNLRKKVDHDHGL